MSRRLAWLPMSLVSVQWLLGDEHQVLPHWLTLLCGTILALLMARLVLKGAFSKYRSTGKSIA